jgi:uncharacterized protein YkwD
MPSRGRNTRITNLTLSILESRETPAVTASVLNGVLTVLGDTGSNDISVLLSNGSLSVPAAGQSFASSSVNTIVVDAGQGNDAITIAAGIGQNCWLFGSSGADRIISQGFGNNLIYGGNGDDTLQGGAGNDTFYGGAGNDIMSDSQGANEFNQTSPTQTASLDAISSQIVTLVNQQRAANGLAALSVNPILTFSAGLHSTQMAQQSISQGLSGAMQHTLMGVALPTMVSRNSYAGYDYTAIGENIAFGFQSASDVMVAWMNSSGHRANILDGTYTEIGVSVKANRDGVLYFTQEFGKPINPTLPSNNPLPSSSTITISGSPAPKLVTIAANAGGSPRVLAFNAATGAQRFEFSAYDSSFRGGVRVATGDITGDGIADVVVAPGPGGGPHIKVIDGSNGQVVRNFFAYSSSFTGGVFIATGDVNGDGRDDIITAAGAGGGPHIRVISGANGAELASFFAYDSQFIGGVTVAAGDVNGDGRADIITGPGKGGGPHVRVFRGGNFTELFGFFAYDAKFTGGVTVAAGDINADGRTDIITGPGAGGGPHVRAFSGINLSQIRSFFAYGADFTGGLWLASHDVDGDGRDDFIISGGPGSPKAVRWISGLSLDEVRATTFDSSFHGGCFVG